MKLSRLVLAIGLLVSTAALAAGTIAARHGMTADQYQSEFASIVGQGYRPTHVDGYMTPDGMRYAAIWLKSESARKWIARHGLSTAKFQTEFDKNVAAGYRLTDVSAADGGIFAGIWEQGEGPAWEAHAGQDYSTFIDQFNAKASAGWRLTDIEGYQENNGTKFASIWQKNDGRGWYAYINMKPDEYQAKFDEMALKGYWPVHVDGYLTAAGVRYAAIFEGKGNGVAARHGMTGAQYQKAYEDYAAQGFTLKEVSGYSDGQKTRYAALWVQ